MLEMLGTFDWISPADAFVSMWFGGYTPISVYWSDAPPAYYEALLNLKGIAATYGSVMAGEGFIILVPDADEKRARQILEKGGAYLA